MVDKTLFSFLFQRNVFQHVFQSLFRNLQREILPEKWYACPMCFFWFCCTWTIVWWVENLSFWKAFVFSCWCMPANLNIKSDGNQQLENVQSALCWNAHLSECRRSLAPTKVVWDNKRACFESSERFFFNVQSTELTVLKPSVLFFRENRCSRMRTEHRSTSFPYGVEPPCSRPLGIDSAFLCGWSSQLKMVERNPNKTDFLNLLVS